MPSDRAYNVSQKGRARKAEWKARPKGKYAKQKRRALERGITWLFTYEQWIAWWGEDLDRRGTGRGKMCMARYGDTVPYSPENTYKLDHFRNLMRQEG